MPRPLVMSREELHKRIWSESLRVIAREIGISSNGLRKHCKRHNIPMPARGYWAGVRAGKIVHAPAVLPPCERARPIVIYFYKGGAIEAGKQS